MKRIVLFAILVMSCSLGIVLHGLSVDVKPQIESKKKQEKGLIGFVSKYKVLIACSVAAALAGGAYWYLSGTDNNKHSKGNPSQTPSNCKKITGITLVQGDMTQQQFYDPQHAAIVNAANPPMLGGGGIDGAIHAAAGPGLVNECRAVPVDANGQRCPVGEARITGGHNLAPLRIIHTVGPDTRIVAQNLARAALLRNAYQNSLNLANANQISAVALPSISTGVYGYDIQEAAAIAIDTAIAHTRSHPESEVRFVTFGERSLQVYRDMLSARCALQEQIPVAGGASVFYRFEVK